MIWYSNYEEEIKKDKSYQNTVKVHRMIGYVSGIFNLGTPITKVLIKKCNSHQYTVKVHHLIGKTFWSHGSLYKSEERTCKHCMETALQLQKATEKKTRAGFVTNIDRFYIECDVNYKSGAWREARLK